VRHRTGYEYASQVRASYNEARMTPVSGGGQHALESRVETGPPARLLRYVDYWGTVVHAFDVHVPHIELVVTATSVVETAGPRPAPPETGWEALAEPAVRDRFAELTVPSRYVLLEPEVVKVGEALAAAHRPAEAGRRAVGWVHDQLDYVRGVTGVHSTSAEARAAARGVCQDYAHLALALLRGMGLPSRYVSGYLLPDGDGAVGRTTAALAKNLRLTDSLTTDIARCSPSSRSGRSVSSTSEERNSRPVRTCPIARRASSSEPARPEVGSSRARARSPTVSAWKTDRGNSRSSNRNSRTRRASTRRW